MLKQKLLSVYNKIVDYNIARRKRIASGKFDSLPKPIIKTTDETIDFIINNRCSVSRFGDGEFAFLMGRGIAFQKYDKKLALKFKAILKEENSKHISCLPYPLLDQNDLLDQPKKYWDNFFRENYYWFFDCFSFGKIYFDTQMSRVYIDTKDKKLVKKRFNTLNQIWDNQNILFVEGEKSRLGVGNDLFTNSLSVRRILAPSKNAFAQYDTIIAAVKEYAAKGDLILIALGPTATALAWDLSKLGYWAIDIGHIDVEYEWMLIGATEKVAVKNKFVGDILAFDEKEHSDLVDYRASIIETILCN